MKFTYYLFIASVLVFLGCKKDDPIAPIVTPDPPKEVVLTDTSMVVIAIGFEELLISKKLIPDAVADGRVKYGDVKNIDSLKIGSTGYDHNKFISIKGIEYFPELKYLNMAASYVDSVDLSKNTKLEYVDCSGLSSGGGLLATVKYVNVTKCKNLKYLDCHYNLLPALDVSQNTELTFLNCLSNKLTSLDISQNSMLKNLNTSYNDGIESLDLSKAKGLQELRCADNTLASLDVSLLPELLALDCSYNFDEQKKAFETLNLKNNTKLMFLNLSGAQVTSIDLSKNPDIEELALTSSKIQTIDLKGLSKLKSLSFGYSDLLEADVTSNTKLESLSIGGSKIKDIDLRNNVNLNYLECYFQDYLTSLDLRSNTKLEYCYTSGSTNLKSICVSKLPNLSDGKWIVSEWTKISICK